MSGNPVFVSSKHGFVLRSDGLFTFSLFFPAPVVQNTGKGVTCIEVLLLIIILNLVHTYHPCDEAGRLQNREDDKRSY